MKASVYHQYGGPEVVRIEDVPKPTPRGNELLVKVLATTITAGDWRALTLEMPPGFGAMGRLMFGLCGPRREVLGMEFAGVVEALGPTASRFRVGDAVFGSTGTRMGAHAEFLVVPEDGHVAAKPEGFAFEEAAALSFGPSTALYFLDKAALKPAESVLVLGAAGGVGTAVVQLAKHMGGRVTGVTSAANLELVRSIGAERVLDRGREDPLAGSERYDLVVDTVGLTSFAQAKTILRPGGRFLAVATSLGGMLAGPMQQRGGFRFVSGVAKEGRAVAERIAGLARAGALRPVIDSRYDLERIGEAHARVASRRKRGNVVVTLRHAT